MRFDIPAANTILRTLRDLGISTITTPIAQEDYTQARSQQQQQAPQTP